MPTQPITLTFPTAVNVSLQVGDTVYYLASNDEIVEIGLVTSIVINANGTVTVTAQIDTSASPPTNTSYIFFTKDSCSKKHKFSSVFSTFFHILGGGGEFQNPKKVCQIF